MDNNDKKTELKPPKKLFDKDAFGAFAKSTAQKVGDASKKVIANAKTAAEARNIEKQDKDREARLKKYNPLFPDRFESADFHKPNLIVIVDDAVRKGIDVCEGAIGWLSEQKGVEVLYLYDEAIPYSGLTFAPAAMCDCAYYVDPHDRNKYQSVDTFFSAMQEDKLAELQHVAYSLGAKSYHVEMTEGNAEGSSDALGGSAKGKGIIKVSAQVGNTHSSSSNSQSVAMAAFSGNRIPQKPSLCWFEHDKNVLNLIDMCCRSGSKPDIAEYTIEVINTSSISASAASKVDSAVKGIGISSNFEKKSKEEHSKKLFFSITF